MPDLRDLQPAVRTLAMPADTNPSGDIFGGWLLAQMDIAAGPSPSPAPAGASPPSPSTPLTFHQPVLVGDIVSCYADVVRVGRTSITLQIEAWAKRGQTGEEIKVTEAKFTCVAIDEHRKPRPVPAHSAPVWVRRGDRPRRQRRLVLRRAPGPRSVPARRTSPPARRRRPAGPVRVPRLVAWAAKPISGGPTRKPR